MTASDFRALFPLVLLGALPVATLLSIAVRRNHVGALAITLFGFGLAALAILPASASISRQVTPLLFLDRYSFFYCGLVVAASLVVALLSYPYLRLRPGNHEEYYLLLQLATVGAAVLGTANHFASLFLGLEILTVSLYGLLSYLHWRRSNIEAGLKYLILAGVSTAFLVFGMALVYSETGTMQFPALGEALARGGLVGASLAGLAMMSVGIGFKLALVPFHLWAPDVYEGAPAPASAFVATVSKLAVFALLLRLLNAIHVTTSGGVFWMVALAAAASMLVGNLLALRQGNVKRMLAYSSISHMGYLMVAVLSGGSTAVTAGTFYLAGYAVAVLGAFGVITLLSSGSGVPRPDSLSGDFDRLEDYQGLAFRQPMLAAVFTAMLFSLAGLPLTAGFLGKFLLVAAGAKAEIWWLLLALVLGSVISLAYYLRIAIAVYTPIRSADSGGSRLPVSLLGNGVLALLTLALLWLGVYPAPLVELIQSIAPTPSG